MYAKKLKFLKTVNQKDIFIRSSTSTRVFEVAGGLLTGMQSSMVNKSFPVHTQPSNVSIVIPLATISALFDSTHPRPDR